MSGWSRPEAAALTLSGANTYVGGTQINAGVLNLGVAENAGTSGPSGASGTIVLGGGTLQYSPVNNYDYSGRFMPRPTRHITLTPTARR